MTCEFLAGRAKQFATLIQRIPPERRETARLISVAPGEDWQSVANRTGISVANLQAMNGGVDLKSTTKLVAPSSGVKLTRLDEVNAIGKHFGARRMLRQYQQASTRSVLARATRSRESLLRVISMPTTLHG